MNDTTETFSRRMGERTRGAEYASAIEHFQRRWRWADRICWAIAGVLWIAVVTSPWWAQ